MRIFKDSGITARGRVLPLKDFVLFSDSSIKEFDPEKMRSVIATAEKYLDTPPVTIPLWNYRQYEEQGSVALYSRYYMDRLERMFLLGMAEGYERRGRFTERLLDFIWATLEMSTWVLPEHTVHTPYYAKSKVPVAVGNKYMHGLELGAIYLGASLALVYRYNKEALDAISPLIGERIEYELTNRIIRPYLNCSFWWEGDKGNRVNNWCPWNISNILLVTALIEPDDNARATVVEKALEHIDNFVSWYKPDGGCDEGPTYWGAAAGALFDCLEILYDLTAGKINVYSHPLVKAMGEYIVKMNINGTRFVNFADSAGKCNPDGEQLRRYGERCGSDILIAFGGVMAVHNSPGIHFRHPYRSLKNLLAPIRRAEDVRPLAARSVYFPDLKVMVERESEDPSKGMFLAMKGGNNGESHNHNDVGSFIVYYDGEPVLIDVGVGRYTKKTFSSERYDIWSMQSRYHNLPMFDNVGQMQGGAYASRNESYDPEARSMTAELAGAYTPQTGVTSLVRTASLNGGEVTVEDRIALDKERRIDFCFMTNRAPVLRKEGEILLPMGRALIYDPEALEYTVDEVEPGDLDALSNWGCEVIWRIRLHTSAKDGSFKFKIV